MSSPAPRFRLFAFGSLVALHLLAVAALWSGVTVRTLIVAVVLYALQMFAVTAGYHRYFAHRAFETGAVMRFVFSFLSLSTLQRPVLWWAAKHRDHHRWSDTAADAHSPVAHSAVRSHLTWVFYTDVDHPTAHVHDLENFPEVVWLDRWWRVPFVVLAVVCGVSFGWQGVVALVWSTLCVYHATAAINSVAHGVGGRRYATRDHSRNNGWLALATFGEGWHNNHHRYPSSANQGFFWWELDITWILLRGLQRLGLVWNLRTVPEHVRAGA